jgi:hypothetical protein
MPRTRSTFLVPEAGGHPTPPPPRWSRASRAALAGLWIAAAPAGAEPPAPEPASEAAEHVHHHGASPSEGDAAHPRHHVMVMAGPGVADSGRGFLSTGVGYEYRLPALGDRVGIGGMVELMLRPGDPPHQMMMASASVHPGGGSFLGTAVGMTHRHEGGGAGGEKMKMEALLRLSAGYDLHAGSLMVAPYVNVDASPSSRAISAGLCVGRMF